MTFEIMDEIEFDLGFCIKDVVDEVILAGLDALKCPYEAEVSITFTNDEGIKEINAMHRGIDQPTDVLSFPLNEFQEAGDFTPLEETGCFHPDTGELMLGDIVISIERLKFQASQFGHSERRELAFLILHSVLHLCGFDHIEDDERVIMERKQEEILKERGYMRE